MINIENILQTTFGYSSFKKGQKETIESVLSQPYTLSILPTGTGKSLCYQLPSYQLTGITIIVSSLLSLMEDQVRQLQQIGEKKVIAINSQMDFSEKNQAMSHLSQYKFVFVSPETLLQEAFLQRLRKVEIGLFVVDEAHCISQWGIDFRPEYIRLKEVIDVLNCKKVLALTATATDAVIEDIQIYLFGKSKVNLIRFPVNRSNIVFSVNHTQDKLTKLIEYITTYEGPGIIYFSSKKIAEEVTYSIQQKTNLKVTYYHGDLSSQDRSKIQNQFLHNQLDLLCATSAFGMGINKQDIRYIIHYHLPNSLEAYVQEVGRAGRDGKRSEALLLYAKGDEQIHELMQMELKDFRKMITYLKTQQKIRIKNMIESMNDLEKKLITGYLNGQYSMKYLENNLQRKEEEKKAQLTSMLEYIFLKTCRRTYINTYFDVMRNLVKQQKICCDNCGLLENVIEYKRKVESLVIQEDNYWEVSLKKLFFKEI